MMWFFWFSAIAPFPAQLPTPFLPQPTPLTAPLSLTAASPQSPLSVPLQGTIAPLAQASPSPAPRPSPSPSPAAPTPSPSPSPTPPAEWVRVQEVRPLPGRLNGIPVFNSNSPELLTQGGILLSTLSPQGKQTPAAHLDYRLTGYFDLFGHHIAKADPPDDRRTLYWGVLLHNPSPRPVTVDILRGYSYLSQPDAPFIPLPPWLDNALGQIFAGPGSRVTTDMVRRGGNRPSEFPDRVEVPPLAEALLLALPIPVKTLDPPLNGRSTLLQLRSNGPVQLASLAQFATPQPDGTELPPSLADWQTLAQTGSLATPRDRVPTPLEATSGSIIYSRVAGVALGSRWEGELTDPGSPYLQIPAPGSAFSYGISLLHGGTLGTGQVQSGSLVVRYPDTAYQAHGNYGVAYDLTLPLINPSSEPRTVTVSLETPLKENSLSKGGLRFFVDPPNRIFYRGTVRIRYTDDRRLPQTRHVHLVQRRGEAGQPLVTLNLPPDDRRWVNVTLVYPADSTPPQVLTVQTLDPAPINPSPTPGAIVP